MTVQVTGAKTTNLTQILESGVGSQNGSRSCSGDEFGKKGRYSPATNHKHPCWGDARFEHAKDEALSVEALVVETSGGTGHAYSP